LAPGKLIVAERGLPLLASVLLGSAAAGCAGVAILPSPVGFAAIAASAASLAAGLSLYRSVSMKYSRLQRLAERIEVAGGEVRVGLHGVVGVGVLTVSCSGWRSVERRFSVRGRHTAPASLRLEGGYTLLSAGRRVYVEAPAACIVGGELKGCCVCLIDPYSANVRDTRATLVVASRGSIADAVIAAGRRGVEGVVKLSGRGRASVYLEASGSGGLSVSVRLAEVGPGGERRFTYRFKPSTAITLLIDQATVTPYAIMRAMGLQPPLLSGFSSARLRVRLVLEAGGSRAERSLGLNRWPPAAPPR